jgi:glycosyltransferase involved in cell wall biosynthesis
VPTISVVTPALNQGRFIERTVRSVLEQNYSALEYVVRDGGSTDETLGILGNYADCIRVISEFDHGQADAVNRGVRATSGEIIGWLNSDDIYCAGALSTVAEFMASRPEVDVAYGDAQVIDAVDTVLGPYYTEPWNPARLAERCFLCQPAVFFRRRVVERFGLLDERLHYCMDYEYWLRLAAGGAMFAYVPAMLAASRQYPETKTLGSRLAVHQEINTMLRQRLGRVPDTWLVNHAHTLVELNPHGRHGPWPPYSVNVVGRALRLSWQWNRSVSFALLATLLGPLITGAGRRTFQSRSPTTRHPAS